MSCVPIAFFGGSPGGGEMLVTFLVVLVLFGAKNLPEIARTIGKTLESLRNAARDVSDEIMTSDVSSSRPRPHSGRLSERSVDPVDAPDGSVPGLPPVRPIEEEKDAFPREPEA